MDGISLTPAAVQLTPGNSYELAIKNLNAFSVKVKLKPIALEAIAAENRLTTSKVKAEELSDYISVEKAEIEVAGGQEIRVKVDYKQELPKQFLGIGASAENSDTEPEVGLTSELISVILKTDLDEATRAQINSAVKVEPTFSIGSIQLLDGARVTAQLANGSDRLLLVGGSLELIHNDKRSVDRALLTNELAPRLYPGAETSAGKELRTDKPFWQRIGIVTYRQDVSINGQAFVSERSFISLPLEVVGITLIVLLVAIALLAKVKSRKHGDKHSKGKHR